MTRRHTEASFMIRGMLHERPSVQDTGDGTLSAQICIVSWDEEDFEHNLHVYLEGKQVEYVQSQFRSGDLIVVKGIMHNKRVQRYDGTIINVPILHAVNLSDPDPEKVRRPDRFHPLSR